MLPFLLVGMGALILTACAMMRVETVSVQRLKDMVESDYSSHSIWEYRGSDACGHYFARLAPKKLSPTHLKMFRVPLEDYAVPDTQLFEWDPEHPQRKTAFTAVTQGKGYRHDFDIGIVNPFELEGFITDDAWEPKEPGD